jgi:hypothetical protein
MATLGRWKLTMEKVLDLELEDLTLSLGFKC